MSQTAISNAQDKGSPKLNLRYGIEVNKRDYPQVQPKEALESVLKAIDRNKIDYMMAQLADPDFVDDKVREYKMTYKGEESSKIVLAFDRLSKETADYFAKDPLLVKDLRRFVAEAEWDVNEGQATGTVKGLLKRKIIMHKREDRWFLDNQME